MPEKFVEKSIYYFKKPGKPNTEDTLRFVKSRSDELGIDTICVTTDTGYTAFKAREILPDKNLVAVSYNSLGEDARRRLIDAGVKVVIGTPVLANIDRAIRRMWGGITPVYLIAQVLKIFGEAFKVCFEVSVMAADAGVLPLDREVIVVAGTIRGTDTAMVMLPACSNSFFDIRVKEIICKPRERPARWFTDPDKYGREYVPAVRKSGFAGDKVDIEKGGE